MEKRLTLAAAALALAVIGLLPVLMIVASTFYVAGEFSLTAYQALLASSKQLALLMGRSVLLSLSVTVLAMIVGTPLGVLLGKTDLPLRGARHGMTHDRHRAFADFAAQIRRRTFPAPNGSMRDSTPSWSIK
jgi:ABC-type Fe3+ transport system permease subunit